MKQKFSMRTRIITAIVCVAAICLGAIGFAALSPERLTTRPADSANPLDQINYIEVTEKDGIKYITYKVNGADGKPTASKPEKGDIRLHDSDGDGINDYMYVFGYAYNSVDTPNPSSLTNWKNTNSNTWGCVALDKSRTSYPAPAGYINNYEVRDMSYAYANCKNLTTTIDNNGKAPFALPQIPHTVIITSHAFDGCTSLEAVSLTTANWLSSSTFENCPNLTRIYLGASVNFLPVYIFGDTKSATFENNQTCVFSFEEAHAGDDTVIVPVSANYKCHYNADIMMWALGYDE